MSVLVTQCSCRFGTFALHAEEEQQSTTSQRVGVRIVRSGVGRPRLDISEDLLEALHVTAEFRWAAIARCLHARL